jgi:hypothetical protein
MSTMDAVVISAVAALAGVVLGQLLARSGEYGKWLREERHRAAAELLAAAEALRRHSAARVVGRYVGTTRDDPADEHLADLERLTLAAEAVRTVFPPTVATLADQLSDAAQELAYVGLKQRARAGEPSPGDLYSSARAEFTGAARRLIAPTSNSRTMPVPMAGATARRTTKG